MKVSTGVKGDGWRKGTKLYKIIWEGFSAALSTWEPEENIHPEVLEDYEAGLEAEAELDAEKAAELERGAIMMWKWVSRDLCAVSVRFCLHFYMFLWGLDTDMVSMNVYGEPCAVLKSAVGANGKISIFYLSYLTACLAELLLDGRVRDTDKDTTFCLGKHNTEIKPPRIDTLTTECIPPSGCLFPRKTPWWQGTGLLCAEMAPTLPSCWRYAHTCKSPSGTA